MVRSILIFSALLFSLFTPVTTISAQVTDSQLRRENERLREQNRTLSRELEALKKRITSLEKEVKEIRKAIAENRALPFESENIDNSVEKLPDNPLACPDSLRIYLEEEYDAVFKDKSREDKQDLLNYKREVQRWCKKINRQIRGDVTWLVRYEHPQKPDDADNAEEQELVLTVLDKNTLKPVGDSFSVPLSKDPKAAARKLKMFKNSSTDLFTIDAMFICETSFDPDADPGMFRRADLVGPFARFGFALNIRTVTPVTPSKESDNKQKGKSSN